MSDFNVCVSVVQEVLPHPNADRLVVVRLQDMDYNIISDVGNYNVGDKVAYIPAQSILPDPILRHLDMVDSPSLKKLDNRRCIVKVIKLRGEVSEGLLLKVPEWIDVGADVAQAANITKYTPAPPRQFSGVLRRGSLYGIIPTFDLNPLQKQKSLFESGEPVTVTEKLHGTQVNFGAFFKEAGFIEEYITSKGLSKQGVSIDHNDESNKLNNTYIRVVGPLMDKVTELLQDLNEEDPNITGINFCGEIVGPKIQDLTYGLQVPTLFLFAVRFKYKTSKDYEYGDFFDQLAPLANKLGVQTVPLVFPHEFEFDYAEISRQAELDTLLPMTTPHLREGVVVSGKNGKRAKFVGNRYKLRGGEATELE